MASKRPFSNRPEEGDELDSSMTARQIAHRLRKKFEAYGIEERRRLFIDEMRRLEIPDEMREKILREFG